MGHLTLKQVLGGLFFVGAVHVACPQTQGGHAPTTEIIVARMQVKNAERQTALQHYSSERTYRVEYKGTGGAHWGEMLVHAEYTAPDQKRFSVVSESGSKIICNRVLRRLIESEQEATQSENRLQTALSAENYNIELAGEEQVGGVRAWVLKVSPKVDNKFTYRGRVWVSADDYAVIRIQGEPAKNPSWWINRASFDSQYVHRGEFWLPGRNVSTSHVRIGGDATLTIDYGAYESVTQQRQAGAAVMADGRPEEL